MGGWVWAGLVGWAWLGLQKHSPWGLGRWGLLAWPETWEHQEMTVLGKCWTLRLHLRPFPLYKQRMGSEGHVSFPVGECPRRLSWFVSWAGMLCASLQVDRLHAPPPSSLPFTPPALKAGT